jgi:hypothetical protein
MKVILATALAIATLWIAMAATALWTAVRGFQNGREDWGVGWGLVGLFLLAAGTAAAVGTWWHLFRVARRGGHS